MTLRSNTGYARIPRRFFAVSLFVIAAVVAPYVTGCHKASKPPLRIAFNTWLGYTGFYIAEEKGFFAKRGIKVETSVIDPLDQKNAALAADSLDGMGGTADSAIVSVASKASGKIVFVFDRSNGADGILANASIKSVQDLKGKRIAVEEGFAGHLLLLSVLEKNGMSSKDVTLVPMSTDQAGAAFAASKVDAAVSWEPYLTTALSRPGAHVLITTRSLDPLLLDTLFMSDKSIMSRADDVQALVSGLGEANDYWLLHPEEGNRIAAEHWKLSLPEVVKTMSGAKLFPSDQQSSLLVSVLPQILRKVSGYWMGAGVVKVDVSQQSIADAQFADRITKP